jgi:PKD repeat protein
MKRILIYSLIFFINFEIISQISYVSQTDGSWSTAATWNPNGVPTKFDFVTIDHNVTGYVGNNYSECATLTITGNGTLDLNNSPYSLRTYQIGNSFINNGTITNGYIYPIANISISGSGVFSNIGLNKGGGTLDIDCDITFDKRVQLVAGADLYINSSNTVTMNAPYISIDNLLGIHNSGTIILNDLNFNDAFNSISGDFIVNTPGAIPNPRDGFKNLTLNSANTFETGGAKYGGGNVIINGDLTIAADNIFSNNIDLKGDLILENSELNLNSNTLLLNGTSSQSISEVGSGILNISNLVLDNSSGVSINSGTVNISNFLKSNSGTITQNGGNIILLSNSISNEARVKLNSSSEFSYSSGDFTVQRNFSATDHGWRMLACPIKNATLSNWDSYFNYCGISGGTNNYSYANCGNFYSVYTYNENLATSFNDGYVPVTSLSQNISDATGTFIYTNSGTYDITVTGTPEFDDISEPITASNDGWNLVSNPYPSTIDFDSLTSIYGPNNGRISDAYYIYEHESYSWLTFTSGTRLIPHSQGFWVKCISSGDLDFNIGTSVESDAAAFTRSSNGINYPLKLKLTNHVNNKINNCEIFADAQYSENYELGDDIIKFFSPYPDYVSSIYFIDNQGNELYMPKINNNQSIDFPIGVITGEYVNGLHTLSFENLDEFMIGSCIELEDLSNGIITDLRNDSIYSFYSDSTSPNPRFILHIDVNYDINVTNLTCFNDSSASVSLTGISMQNSYFNLIDSNGLVIDSIFCNQDSIVFDNLNAGNYSLFTNHSNTCSLDNQNIVITQPVEIVADFNCVHDTIFLDSNGLAELRFINLSQNSNSFTWDFGDGNSSVSFSPTHTYNNSGNYNVTLIAYNDTSQICSDISLKTITVLSPYLNINEYRFKDVISVSNNLITFNKDFVNNDALKVYLYDLNGKILNNFKISRNNNIIDLSNIKFGIYLISVLKNDKQIYSSKIPIH